MPFRHYNYNGLPFLNTTSFWCRQKSDLFELKAYLKENKRKFRKTTVVFSSTTRFDFNIKTKIGCNYQGTG